MHEAACACSTSMSQPRQLPLWQSSAPVSLAWCTTHPPTVVAQVGLPHPKRLEHQHVPRPEAGREGELLRQVGKQAMSLQAGRMWKVTGRWQAAVKKCCMAHTAPLQLLGIKALGSR